MVSVDNVYLPILFFSLLTGLFVIGFMWDAFSDVDVIWSQAQHGQTIKARGESFFSNLDFFMVCLYIGLHLSVIALALLLRSHPVMLMGGIAFIILLLLISPVISNAFIDNVAADPVFSNVVGDYPMSVFIMGQLPVIEFVWAIMTGVLMFGLMIRRPEEGFV